ncbi:MAG: ATP-binding protein [Anaerohalosphaera sp.]|nr:ATP-binding protein [Anaerohalosphaera sp.]
MAQVTFKTKAEQRAKKASEFPAEFGKLNLEHIRSHVEDILKLIGRDGIFQEYTLHDMTHVDAMLESLDQLIPSETIEIMTSADWLLIVLACYFHDLGLLVTKDEYSKREGSDFPRFRDEVLLAGDIGIDYKEALSYMDDEELEKFYYQEFVRHHHAERIYHWIKGQASDELGACHETVDAINSLLDGLDEKLRDDLALICRSHHLDDLDQIDSLYVLRRAYGQDEDTHANLQYGALLLRTADLLQIRKNRTPAVMLKLIDPANPKSQNEWAKQAKVRAILAVKSEAGKEGGCDTIEVQADFTEASGFFGLTAYLQYVELELKQSYEWCKQANAKGAKHTFPWRYVNDDQVEAKGFLPKKYEFILDRKKILDLLTGHTLYNDATVAIREILQNSIDAVRFQKHLKPDEALGTVQVHWNSETKQLVIRDTGTGMTQYTIVKNFLNVGVSFYQQKKFKEKYPDFSSISKFGIGVLSYFMISNNIEVLSVHPDEEMAHRITLPSATQRYLIKTVPKDDEDVKAIGPHGTQVTLVIRPSAKLTEIEKILRYWIVLPKCEMTYIEDDEAPKKIGFNDTIEALTYYVEQSQDDASVKEVVEIKRSESAMGIDLAYAVRFWRWFKVWHILTRRKYRVNSSKRDEDLLLVPPGVCVEGVRVSSRPPGYSNLGPWALANLTGVNAPRTNVVRSDLEQSKELKAVHSEVYKLLGNQITNEFQRIVTSGGGITKASTEANFMIDILRNESVDKKKVENCIDSLPVFTIEESSGRKTVSRKDLQQYESVWTVDSLLVDRLDSLCETMDVNHSSAEIIRLLTHNDNHGIHLPRIIGKSNEILHDFAIKSVLINLEDMSISLEWKKKNDGMWREIPEKVMQEIREEMPWTDSFDSIKIASSSLKCNKPDINWIVVRGIILCLEDCPISILWNTFADNEDAAIRWIAHMLSYKKIKEGLIPRFREDLRDAGKDPKDILPKMIVRDEMIFDIKSVLERGRFIY